MEPRKLRDQIFDLCLFIFLSALLLRAAMWMLVECWPALAITALAVAIIILAWNVYKHYLRKW